jgi:hypothetical protein
MRIITRRAAILVTAGALGLGGLAVAAPALAGAGPFGSPASATAGAGLARGAGNGMGPGTGMGTGMDADDHTGPGTGMGTGMDADDRMGPGTGMGTGAGGGSCSDVGVTAAKGTLSEQQEATLAAMAQEEKVARDLYTAFAASYPAVIFDHIAAAESRHLSAVHTLLTRYGLADPTTGRPAGQFSDPAVRATYNGLLGQGQASQAAALRVGQTVERTDIADLQAALVGLTAPDLTQVYTSLLAASRHHLTAFGRWSER